MRGPRARDAILERFAALPCLLPGRGDHVAAADRRNDSRRRGIQVDTIDALLAWLCIRFELTLLTTDEGLADPTELVHSIHMKRTNLVLDEQILEEATRLSGEKTYSAAVMRALEDYVRRVRARQILELRGSGAWEGDLGEMRRDTRPTRSRKKRAS